MKIVKLSLTGKAKPYRIQPERLTLEYAKEQGYKILTFGDGYGEVLGPDGQHYIISGFRCNCPDAEKNEGGTFHGYCKHSWWLSQLHICEECGTTAELMEFEELKNCLHRFSYICPSCGDVKTVSEVHEIRKRWKQEAERAVLAERAQQASTAIFAH